MMRYFNFSVIVFGMVVLTSCQCNTDSKPKFIRSQYESRHNAPFSDATEYDGLLFLTGQIGKDHKLVKFYEALKKKSKENLRDH